MIHYLIPSGCVSALNVPYLHVWFTDVFSTFKLANLALALVSTLLVVESIVKGPRGDDVSVSVGKSLRRIEAVRKVWFGHGNKYLGPLRHRRGQPVQAVL